jgi:hypothetical protein
VLDMKGARAESSMPSCTLRRRSSARAWLLAIALVACGSRTSSAGGSTSSVGGTGGAAGGTGGAVGICSPGESPTQLLADVTNLYALAIDDTHVYSSVGSNAIVRVSKWGGAVEVLASSGANVLAVDSSHVYWFEPSTNTVLSTTKPGGGILTVAKTNGHTQRLLVDDVAVYWSSTGAAQVLRVDKPAGSPVVIYQPSPAVPTVDLALDDAHVYARHLEGGVVRFDKMGGGVTAIGDVGQQLHTIAVDDTSVYASADESGVFRLPKSGGAAELLADIASPRGLAVDEGHVYVASKAEGVVRLSKSSGAQDLVASGAGPWSVAVDSTCVYWTTLDKTIWRAPKP